jgi:tetratricopeptide (TPR) repeat protein
MLERCLELRRRLGREVDIAATYSTLAFARMQTGDAAGALASEREALQIFRKLGDRRGETIALVHVSEFELWRGDLNAARSYAEQALAIASDIGHRVTEGECQCVLGAVFFDAGEVEEAEARFDQSLAVCREAADKQGEAKAIWWLGRSRLESDRAAEAGPLLSQALRAFQKFGMREELLGCLEDHVALLLAEGRLADGWRLAEMAQATRERLALVRSPRGEARWQAQMERLRAAAPAAGFNDALQEGRRMGTDAAVDTALGPVAAAT